MMSKGQWKDFLIEIRKSFSRYLSIFFMVALGTSFFSGLKSSEPDMKESLDAYLDQTGYMNIRVLSTLGMSEDDVTALGAIKGVTDAEGLYSVDGLSPCIDITALGTDASGGTDEGNANLFGESALYLEAFEFQFEVHTAKSVPI